MFQKIAETHPGIATAIGIDRAGGSTLFLDREIPAALCQRLKEGGKVLLLWGARQVAKTPLARRLIAALPFKTLALTGDDAVVSALPPRPVVHTLRMIR